MKSLAALPKSRAHAKSLLFVGTVLIVGEALGGCAAHLASTPPPPVKISIEDCRATADYYHTSGQGGGGVVVFENKDSKVRTIVFKSRWPFRGLPHKIVVGPHRLTHEYRIDQFANRKAAEPDTFLFDVSAPVPDDLCGAPPGGPGVIVDG